MALPKTALVTTSALVLAAASLVGSAPTAEAASGCSYPYVCIYNVSGAPGNLSSANLVGRFKDITSAYQNVVNRSKWTVVNTRQNDSVYVKMTDGAYECLYPIDYINSSSQVWSVLWDSTHVLDKIKIIDSASC